MDDVRDPVLVEGPLDRGELGDVAALEHDPAEVLVARDLADPARVRRLVEGDDDGSLVGEVADGPGADAAQRARDQEALLASPCGRL